MSEFEIGDAVYCLAGKTTMLALGVVAPPDAVNADTLDGYDSTAFWRKGEAVNADALDGIDSLGFLQRQVAGGTERIWWAKGSVNIAGGQSSHAYPINRPPQALAAICEGDRAVPQLGAYSYDLVNHLITLQWFTAAGGVPGNQSITVALMVIA